jgi:arylsulfatase A-like enzyme
MTTMTKTIPPFALKLPLIIPLLLLAIAMPRPAVAAPPPRDMNILMIVAEDWSSFALGCYGNPIVRTPNLDRLAARGVRFNRAYAQATVCNPSRASFVTGLRPDTTQVFGNVEVLDRVIPAGAPGMGQTLAQRGAFVGSLGKLVHKWDDAARFAQGFNLIEYTHDYDVPPKFAGEHRIVPAPPEGPLWAEDEALLLPEPVGSRLRKLKEKRDAKLAAGAEDNWNLRKPFQQLYAEQLGDSGLPEERMEDGRIARRTVELLKKLGTEQRQFFLSVGLYATHTPLLAPKKYVDLYDPAKMPLSPATRDKDRDVPAVARRMGQNYDLFNGMYPEFGPTPERERQAIASYYACATYLDTQIGLILDALEASGQADNTIVVFFADHGFHLGEHGMWSKFSLFEQSTRVPLIVRVPGAAGNGRVCDEFVELVDLLPTFADWWSLPRATVWEGQSFAPLLENPALPWKQATFACIPIKGLGRSVRTKDFRYAEWRSDTALPGATPADARELYDLVNDPLEQTNLVNNPLHSAVLREHEALLRAGPPAARASRAATR